MIGPIKNSRRKKTYKYLGILKVNTFRKTKMKGKVRKEYLRRRRKLIETKLSSRDLIKEINTCAVSLVWYSGLFLNWTRGELRHMDNRIRKLVIMHRPLHFTVCDKKWRRKKSYQHWRLCRYNNSDSKIYKKEQREDNYSCY